MTSCDIVIVGGGPAGYSAALYAARSGLDVIVLERLCAGGQMVQTNQIKNYPGFAEGIDGFTLGGQMQAGAHSQGARTVITQVTGLRRSGSFWIAETDSEEYHAKAVIIATGADPRRLGIPGEPELSGKGISYCAACDGMLYQGKDAVIIGGGNTAAEDALSLSRLCRKVYLIHRRDELRCDTALRHALSQLQNLDILWNSQAVWFHGSEQLTACTVRNTPSGQLQKILCDGAFIAIGRKPVSDPFRNVLPLDPGGYILTDDRMHTAVPGLLAAGDVRSKELRQILTAASDGALAAVSAARYISKEF